MVTRTWIAAALGGAAAWVAGGCGGGGGHGGDADAAPDPVVETDGGDGEAPEIPPDDGDTAEAEADGGLCGDGFCGAGETCETCADDCGPCTPDYTDFYPGAPTSILDVTESDQAVVVTTDEYELRVDFSGCMVDFTIRPVFTQDYIRYRKVDPTYRDGGTVDEDGVWLDEAGPLCSTLADRGSDGAAAWFLEAFDGFSVRHGFTFYRDYLELEATYLPGTRKVLVTYFIALYGPGDSLHPMIVDNEHFHRYMPGMGERTTVEYGIGGWYPNFMIFAPACDMRVHEGTMGVEWGYDETVAYIYSPVWMRDMGEGGGSAFLLAYTSLNSVVPNVALGTEETFSTFIRPYMAADGADQGHDAAYARWVAPRIAAAWGNHDTPVFPLAVMHTSTWSSDFTSWVEGSQVKVATYSGDPGQIDWNYKSSIRAGLEPDDPASVPDDWEILREDGSVLVDGEGGVLCTPVSGPYTEEGTYRWHLIEDDPYNEWWHGTRGVFWDEINLHSSTNVLVSDYKNRDDFFLAGFLRLIAESYASGYWDYVMANPYSGTLHIAVASDLSCIEGWLPSSMYGIDFKQHVISVMDFVNGIPEACRPNILVYQNYDAEVPADQGVVYDALLGSARYGFHVALLSYASYESQLHNLQMAEDMFKAMGCSRDDDTRIEVATVDLASEDAGISTAARMVVSAGTGTPTVTFETEEDEYIITNLSGAPLPFVMRIPSAAEYDAGDNVTRTAFSFEGGVAVFGGTVEAEKTGFVVRR